jgi:hypothetical protein
MGRAGPFVGAPLRVFRKTWIEELDPLDILRDLSKGAKTLIADSLAARGQVLAKLHVLEAVTNLSETAGAA